MQNSTLKAIADTELLIYDAKKCLWETEGQRAERAFNMLLPHDAEDKRDLPPMNWDEFDARRH